MSLAHAAGYDPRPTYPTTHPAMTGAPAMTDYRTPALRRLLHLTALDAYAHAHPDARSEVRILVREWVGADPALDYPSTFDADATPGHVLDGLVGVVYAEGLGEGALNAAVELLALVGGETMGCPEDDDATAASAREVGASFGWLGFAPGAGVSHGRHAA